MRKNKFTFYANIFKQYNSQINFDDVLKYLKSYDNETKECRELYKKYIDGDITKDIYSKYKSVNLPAVTFNASMLDNKIHSKANVDKMTGYLHLDYDGLKPSEIEVIKKCISNISFTKIVYLSASGSGLKVIVKVKIFEKEKFFILFQSVDKYYTSEIYKLTGINISSDKQCSNFNRLCFISNDYDYFFSENPDMFNVKETEIPKIVETNNKIYTLDKKDEKLLDKLIDIIKTKKIDITDTYDYWIRCGFVIRNIIKDYNQGIEYFKNISQYNLKYDEKQCIEKYKSLFNSPDKGSKVKIPTIISIMEKHGIDVFFTNEELTVIRDSKVKLEDCKQIMIDDGFTLEYCVIKHKRILKYKEKSFLVDESGNDTVHYIRGWFLENYAFNISNGDVDMVINNLPRIEYNFALNILEKYKTKDTSEIEKVIDCFISTEDNNTKEEMLMRFFLGCVHNWTLNSFDRKFDEMLILRSDYSIGKTTLINDFLFKIFLKHNNIYYITESTNFYERDKDLIYADLTSLVNYKPELADNINKKSDAIKSYISKKTITIRRPFKVTEENFLSYTVFIGDTNNTYFLPEDINNRRFLILPLQKLTFMELDETTNRWENKDINWFKFWGSIYQLKLDGKNYNDYFKIETTTNEDYVSTDRDYQLLKRWIQPGNDREWIYINDLIPLLENNGCRITETRNQKISNSLNRLGFKSHKRWNKEKKKSQNGFYNIKVCDMAVDSPALLSEPEKFIFSL